MSDQFRETTDERIATLLRIAGPRPAISNEARVRVRSSVRREWRSAVRRRSFRRSAMLAAAAIAVVALVLVSLLRRDGGMEPASVVGTVAVADRPIAVHDRDGSSRSVSRGQSIREGETLETGETGVSIRWVDGGSLRLDRDTRLQIVDGVTCLIEEGRAYVDADPHLPSSRLTIHAGSVEVREIGTQFEVARMGDSERIRVREGKVTIRHAGAIHDAIRGEEVDVRADGEVIRRRIAPDDESWEWVQDLAPSFLLEGRTLHAYLGWISRETGLEIRTADAAEQLDTTAIILHGSIEGMMPADSLDAVLPTCGLTSEIEGDGTLLIGPLARDER